MLSTQILKTDIESKTWLWNWVLRVSQSQTLSAEPDNAMLRFKSTESRNNYWTSPKQVQMIRTSIHDPKTLKLKLQILSENCELAIQAHWFQNNHTTSMHNLSLSLSPSVNLNAEGEFQIGVQAPCDQLLG